MPGCCVTKCRNNAQKGFQLFRVPKEPKRQQLWLNLARRDDDCKTPTNLRICEVHFSIKQWTVNNKNKRVLNALAFPDLLLPALPPEFILLECGDQGEKSTDPKTNENNYLLFQHDCKGSSKINSQNDCNYGPPKENLHQNDSSTDSTDVNLIQNSIDEDTLEDIKKTLAELKNAKTKIVQLEEQNNLLKTATEKVFNTDQLKFLQNCCEKAFSWSDSTVAKALKLYKMCGADGYREILKQGLPYPSIRAMQRHKQMNQENETNTNQREDVINAVSSIIEIDSDSIDSSCNS